MLVRTPLSPVTTVSAWATSPLLRVRLVTRSDIDCGLSRCNFTSTICQSPICFLAHTIQECLVPPASVHRQNRTVVANQLRELFGRHQRRQLSPDLKSCRVVHNRDRRAWAHHDNHFQFGSLYVSLASGHIGRHPAADTCWQPV